MAVIAFVLVIIAAVLLIIGFFAETMAWVWGSIGAAALALALLGLAFRRARAAETTRATAEDVPDEELPPAALAGGELSGEGSAGGVAEEEDGGTERAEVDTGRAEEDARQPEDTERAEEDARQAEDTERHEEDTGQAEDTEPHEEDTGQAEDTERAEEDARQAEDTERTDDTEERDGPSPGAESGHDRPAGDGGDDRG